LFDEVVFSHMFVWISLCSHVLPWMDMMIWWWGLWWSKIMCMI